MKTLKLAAFIIVIGILSSCVGRTGKVGRPISSYYQTQLDSLKLGESTPKELKKYFEPTKAPVSLREGKIENGKKVEIWQVAKGGNIDAAALIIWGYVAYNKDQLLLFRFEDDKLASYETVVIPDPPVAAHTTESDRQGHR